MTALFSEGDRLLSDVRSQLQRLLIFNEAGFAPLTCDLRSTKTVCDNLRLVADVTPFFVKRYLAQETDNFKVLQYETQNKCAHIRRIAHGVCRQHAVV